MSQAGSLNGGGSGSSGITTISGDTGSITGAAVTIYANNAGKNSGSTVKFVNSGTTSTMNVTDANNNTLIGKSTGNLSLTSANENTMVGYLCGSRITTGDYNVALGDQCLSFLTTGSNNIGIGYGASASTTGTNNISIGNQLGSALTSGSNNILLGKETTAYTGSESNNILVNNPGLAGESNVTRIGFLQTKVFVSGIQSVTAPLPSGPVLVSGLGQLSDAGLGTAGQVLTSNGAGGSPTWQAANALNSVLSVGMNTDQSIAENTLVDIVYDTSIIDTASGYAIGTGIYTVPATGNYVITFTGNFTSTAGFTNCDVFVNKNAGTYLYHGTSTATVSDPNRTVHNASVVFPLVASDTIKISVFAQTVGATNYTANGVANGYYNTFTVTAL